MQNDYNIPINRGDDLSKDPQIQLIASLGKTAQVLLFILYLDPRPVGEKIISEALGISPETARIHLRELARLNLVARSGRYSGYRSIWRGAQLILLVCNEKLKKGNEEYPLSKVENPRLHDRCLSIIHESKNMGSAENSLSNTEIQHSNTDNPRSAPLTTTTELLLNTNSLREVVVDSNDALREILTTLYKYRIGKN